MARLRKALVPFLLAGLAAGIAPAAIGETSDEQAGRSEETLGDTTIDELIEELEKRGVVGPSAKPTNDENPSETAPDAKSAQSADSAAQNEKLAAVLAWLDRIHPYGDLRGRFEGFVYHNDPLGNDPKDRYRWRYRLRAGLQADINAYLDAAFQLSTGPDANSANQSLGSGPDFDPDGIFVREAYVKAMPLATLDLPLDMSSQILFGKMPNPFRSDKGAALIIWDGDITPEGLSVGYALSPCEALRLNFDFGYYLIEEVSSRSNDPHLLAVQVDSSFSPHEDWWFGFSPSYYAYRNLDQDFYDRGSYAVSGFGSSYGGNVPGGMARGGATQTADFRLWASFAGVTDWPILAYGNVVRNFTARNTDGFGAGKEDLGWSAGLEVGDKKRWVGLGAAYFEVEANATPSNFTDSDLFDGRTNGKGWYFKIVRQIFKNTDLQAEAFLSEPLNDGIFGPTGSAGGDDDPPSEFTSAVQNLDRLRFRLDLIVKW
jgi:hypothetical protein